MYDRLPNRNRQDVYFNEFRKAASDGNLAVVVSGTGAAVNDSTGDQGHPGVAELNLGTTNAGQSAVVTALAAYRLGAGAATIEALLNIPILPTAGEAFTLRAGFLDATTAEPTDGVFFRYSEANAALIVVARQNGNESTLTTKVTPTAGAWLKLRIDVSETASEARFYVNDAFVGSITKNIPTLAGREVGAGIAAIKTAGTTARTVLVDFVYLVKDFVLSR